MALLLLASLASASKMAPTYLTERVTQGDWPQALAAAGARDLVADGIPDGVRAMVTSFGGVCCTAGYVAAMGDTGPLWIGAYSYDGTFLGQVAPHHSLVTKLMHHLESTPEQVHPVPTSTTACTAARAARAAFEPIAATRALDTLDVGLVVESESSGWTVVATRAPSQTSDRQGGPIHQVLASASVDDACVPGPVTVPLDPVCWEPSARARYAVFVEKLFPGREMMRHHRWTN